MSCNLIRKWFAPIILHIIVNRRRAFDWNVEIMIQFGSWIRKWSKTRTSWNAWHMNVVASSSIMVMNWSGNASCNCFLYRCWGRASQPLANFFPCPQPRVQGFSLNKMGGEKPWGRGCPGPCNSPRSLCESSLVPVSFSWVANVSWFSWSLKTIFCLFLQYKVGITLFTVSHRKSLWKYHEVCVSFLFCFALVISVQSLWMVTFKLRHVCNDLQWRWEGRLTKDTSCNVTSETCSGAVLV